MRVLGISPCHDSSVAIINDGRIEYFAKEERLSGVKRDSMPHLVLNFIINNIEGNIDVAVISSPSESDPYNIFCTEFIRKLLNCEVEQLSHQHHLTHASLAFTNSGFQSALVVIVDRMGSEFRGLLREAESVFKVDQEYNFEPIYKSYWLNKTGEEYDENNFRRVLELKSTYPNCEISAENSLSIQKVFETATNLIGQPTLEGGKTMGLAAYGKDKKFKNLFIEGIPNTNLFTHLFEYDHPPILKEYYHYKINKGAPLPKD